MTNTFNSIGERMDYLSNVLKNYVDNVTTVDPAADESASMTITITIERSKATTYNTNPKWRLTSNMAEEIS